MWTPSFIADPESQLSATIECLLCASPCLESFTGINFNEVATLHTVIPTLPEGKLGHKEDK